MTFYRWILQFTDQNNPIGDLARDVQVDKDQFPKRAKKLDTVLKYLESRRAHDDILDLVQDIYPYYANLSPADTVWKDMQNG